MAGRPLRPATRRRLGRPSPHQQADRPRAHPQPKKLSTPHHAAGHEYPVLAPVSEGYPKAEGRLLTCYSPVRRSSTPERAFPLDLHVLSTPPAFVLSQDQTLQQKPLKNIPAKKLLPKESTSIHRCRQEPNNWHWHHKHPVEFSKNNPTRGNSPTLPGDPHRVKPFCRLSSVCTDRTRQCPP